MMKQKIRHIVVTTLAVATFMTASFAIAEPSEIDIAKQELKLEQKKLELEKAKLVSEKSKELAIKEKELELERKKLELEKARKDLQVVETENKLKMIVQGDVLFDTNSAYLKKDAEKTLLQVSMLLNEFPEGDVMITGYADSRGSEDHNQNLSQERANSVRDYLLDNSIVTKNRIATKAMGEDNPVASNLDADGRQQNRRVEISVVKVSEDTTLSLND